MNLNNIVFVFISVLIGNC